MSVVMPSRDHHFRIGLARDRWLWRYSKLKGSADGWTEFATRKVMVHSDLKGRRRLEIELHEGIHMTLGPTISEEAVSQAAADLATILHSLGYRLAPKDN